jgi:hypothetical protein
MKAVRRWLIYRRLLNERAEAPDGVLTELGMQRKALADFAWDCAGLEIYGEGLPPARHEQHNEGHLGRVAIDKA